MAERRNVTVRKYKMGEEPVVDEMTLRMTRGERIDFVWELTRSQWPLKEPDWRESRLRRDVARVIRRRR
jgi:hypothetical protein